MLVLLVAHDVALVVALEAPLALHAGLARVLVVLDALVAGRAGRASRRSLRTLAVELRRGLVRIRVRILPRGLDVALTRLAVLLLGARRALARERVLALRLGRLRLGLCTGLVGLCAPDLRLAADLACLGPARLVAPLASLPCSKPQHCQQDQRRNDDDVDDYSSIHTFAPPSSSLEGYPEGPARTPTWW